VTSAKITFAIGTALSGKEVYTATEGVPSPKGGSTTQCLYPL